jgi:hypothetical protein
MIANLYKVCGETWQGKRPGLALFCSRSVPGELRVAVLEHLSFISETEPRLFIDAKSGTLRGRPERLLGVSSLINNVHQS